MPAPTVGRQLARVARHLAVEVDALTFAAPVTHVYNPLTYARALHENYLVRHARAGVDAVLVGMNPGPWGMAQTGVPFGDPAIVRSWLDLAGTVTRPQHEHPKRPVLGLDSPRSEVSGTRLWGWAASRFETPEHFFARFFVINYCPLVFMEESARNRTPDKLPAAERAALFAACDRALTAALAALAPAQVIGIGAFAAGRARIAAKVLDLDVGQILHPSPASPRANRGWADIATGELIQLGVAIPDPPKRRRAS